MKDSAIYFQITQSTLAIAVTALYSTLLAQTEALVALKPHRTLLRSYRDLTTSLSLSSATSDGDSFTVNANRLAPSSIADHDAGYLSVRAVPLIAAPVIGGINAA